MKGLLSCCIIAVDIMSACRQLVQLTGLYTSVDVYDHILPLAFLLLDDRVHQVRTTALRVVRLDDAVWQ